MARLVNNFGAAAGHLECGKVVKPFRKLIRRRQVVSEPSRRQERWIKLTRLSPTRLGDFPFAESQNSRPSHGVTRTDFGSVREGTKPCGRNPIRTRDVLGGGVWEVHEEYLGAPNVNRVQPASNTSSSSAKFEAHATEKGAGLAISAAQSPRAYFFWKSDLDKSLGTKVL
jgi:hypothetical protein